MSYVEKLHDGLKRADAVQAWGKRFKKLKKTKNLSITKFCDKHGLDNTQISHAMGKRRGLTWETIHAVDTALTKEGV